jgi:arsenate reductase-like glutaredoxin family protein
MFQPGRDHQAPSSGVVQQDVSSQQTGRKNCLQSIGGPGTRNHLEEMVKKVSSSSFESIISVKKRKLKELNSSKRSLEL